jgi:DNA-binding NtrC family response regulator
VPSPPPRAHDAETVLVVEDEEIVRELVCSVLEEQGYKVYCARHGAAALELGEMAKARGETIHLIISDVVMPEMSGPELVKRMAGMQPTARVLYVSGYSENDISDQGILAADIRFLEKPFTPQTLARKVREVLDEPISATTSSVAARAAKDAEPASSR